MLSALDPTHLGQWPISGTVPEFLPNPPLSVYAKTNMEVWSKIGIVLPYTTG